MSESEVRTIEPQAIRRIRGSLGLTQDEFAKELGVSKITIVRWESGDRACKGASARQIYDLERKRCANMIRRTTTIFSVGVDDLSRLDGIQATRTFRDFLYCEARRIGIPINDIDICESELSDGGIDARVNDKLLIATDSIILPGKNYFQIKAGSSAKPWNKSWVQKELFGKSGLSHVLREKIGKEVLRCLEENGRYVLVCFGKDLTPEQISDAKAHLVSHFAQCGYPNAKVEVWGQQHLIGMISPFLSLCLQLTDRKEWKFKYYSSWKLDQDMAQAFCLDEQRNRLILEIREHLFKDEIRHIRLVGDSGVGKTRLALEILSHYALFPSVVYVPNAEDFQSGSLFNSLCRSDAEYFVILVLDNCSSQKCKEIWNSLRNRSNQCRIISIDQSGYETNDQLECVLECPLLPEDKINEIIKNYIGTTSDLRRWAEFCSGSARVAHVIGQNLRDCPENLFREPSTVSIWDKFIAGYSSLESVDVQNKLFVLKYLSLFERFGFESPVTEEAKFIWGLINKADPTVTWSKFQSIIQELKRQRILQGETTLRITPKALHIYLWLRFWNENGRGFLEGDSMDNMPPQLYLWFGRMFPYAHASQVAAQEIKQLLGTEGPFYKSKVLNSTELKLLNELALASPERTLTYIEASIGQCSYENLLAFKKGRQDVVWALEKIAWWPHLFCRAAEVLRRLAETENETHSNNSKGAFADLFSLAPGFSPTGATPLERLSVLENALHSSSSITREVGLIACRKALSLPIHSGFRIVGSEYQGLRQTLSPWMPKTWDEYKDAYQIIWKLLTDASRKWSIDDRAKANSNLTDSARYLLDFDWMREPILRTLNELADDEATNISNFLDTLTHLIRFKSQELPSDLIASLKAIDARITGTTFSSHIRRWIHLSGYNDHFDENGRNEDTYNQRIKNLASEAVLNSDLVKKELPNLITEVNRVVFQFGKDIGECDSEKSLLMPIIDAYRQNPVNASSLFLGGYLKAIFESSPTQWEEIVFGLISDITFCKLIGMFIRDSGFTDTSIEQLLSEYDAGKLDIDSLLCFHHSQGLKSLKLVNIQKLAERFEKAGKILNALELLEDIYCNKKAPKKLPEDLTMRLLKAINVSPPCHSIHEYHWNILAEQFISQFPKRKCEVFQAVLDKSSKDIGCFHSDNSTFKIIQGIIASCPEQCWSMIASKLDTLKEIEIFRFTHWFNSSGLHLTLFPPKVILDWIAEAPTNRAVSIAGIVPPLLTEESAGFLVRELLNRYGDQEQVQDVLLSNFFSGSWVGLESAYFQSKHELAHEWLKKETSMRVRRWLEKYVAVLSEHVKGAKIREEREF